VSAVDRWISLLLFSLFFLCSPLDHMHIALASITKRLSVAARPLEGLHPPLLGRQRRRVSGASPDLREFIFRAVRPSASCSVQSDRATPIFHPAGTTSRRTKNRWRFFFDEKESRIWVNDTDGSNERQQRERVSRLGWQRRVQDARGHCGQLLFFFIPVLTVDADAKGRGPRPIVHDTQWGGGKKYRENTLVQPVEQFHSFLHSSVPTFVHSSSHSFFCSKKR